MTIVRCSVAAGMLCLMVGCGASGPEIASVSGTVTMDGKPLPNAMIVFSPESGRPAGARTDEEGNYVLEFTEDREGAVPGKNNVQIRTAMEGSINEDGSLSSASAETVPTKYNVNSELTFNVEAGKANVANFELDSEGELPQAPDPDDN